MTRCECWQLSFVALLAYARRRGLTTLEELMNATGAGTRCGACRPFLEELLRTGRLRVGDQLVTLPPPHQPAPPSAAPDAQSRPATDPPSALKPPP